MEADRTVRAAVAGLSAGKFREADGDEYDITLRLPMSGRQTLDALNMIEVSSASGRPVPLRQISSPEFTADVSLIERRDRERQVVLSAYPSAGYNTSKVTHAVFERLNELELPPGYAFRAGGEAEAQQESFGGMGTRCWSPYSAYSRC